MEGLSSQQRKLSDSDEFCIGRTVTMKTLRRAAGEACMLTRDLGMK